MPCTTHHYACECREAEFEARIKDLQTRLCETLLERDQLRADIQIMVAKAAENRLDGYRLLESRGA